MVKMANPQEGVFAGASIGYTSNGELQTVTPHHRPGGPDDPYGGWKGLSAHDELDAVYVDGERVPHGETEFVEAGEGEGLRIEVEEHEVVAGDGAWTERTARVETVEMSAGELEAERERLEAEDEAFQAAHDFRPF